MFYNMVNSFRQSLNESEAWPPCNATYLQLLYNNRVANLGFPAYTERYAVWDKLFPKPSGQVGITRGGQLLPALLPLLLGLLTRLM